MHATLRRTWPERAGWRGESLPAATGGGMRVEWRRRILFGLLAVGLLAAVPDLRARLAAEQSDRTVLLVADQPSFAALPDISSPAAAAAAWARLHLDGVGALAVPEDTLASLASRGAVAVSAGAGGIGVRASTRDRALAVWLAASLTRLVGAAGRVHMAAAPRGTFAVESPTARLSSVRWLPLGFDPAAFAAAGRAGMGVVAEPVPAVPHLPGSIVAATYRSLAAAASAAGVVVEGILYRQPSALPIPGAPSALPLTLRAFQAHGWTLDVVETPQQLGNEAPVGTFELSTELRDRTVRVYDVPAWQMTQTPMTQAVADVADAVQERNLRIVDLEPVPGAANALGASAAFAAMLASRLTAEGFHLGAPRPLPAIRVHAVQRVAQALAVIAAALLLLESLWPPVRRFGYQPLFSAGCAAALVAVGSSTLSADLVALGAACAGGGLAATRVAALWDRWEGRGPATPVRVWRSALGASVWMALAAFAGAVVIATVMGDSTHMLEWRYYRGVKVTYLAIPLLAAAVTAVALGWQEAVAATFRHPLAAARSALSRDHIAATARGLVVLALVGVAAWVYLTRSGNVTASAMLGIEVHMREFLGNVLTYRPREKEFLVGYPSVFLAAFFAARRQPWAFAFFAVGASVAPVSIVDTFAHLRTPFLYSTMRGIIGLALGVLTASVALGCVTAGAALISRRRDKPGPVALPAAAAPAVGAPTQPGSGLLPASHAGRAAPPG